MKNRILLCAALFAPAVIFAKAPVSQITPEPLPSGVTTVAPAQGFVDLSGSASPLGISDIAVNFSSTIDMNPSCTEPALLYFNDFTTPADQTTSKSVDLMTFRAGGVQFKNYSWKQTGIYKVEIPEGFWKFDSGSLTPALTLYYEIYVGYNVLPAPGVVPELSNVYITFADADEVRFNTSGSRACEFYMDNSDAVYGLTKDIIDYNGDGKKNTVVFGFGSSDGISQEFIQPGTFGLRIDPGFIEYITYGPNYANDKEDFVLRTNDELLFKYQIPAIPIPEIYPYTDEPLEYFDEFTLYMPDNFDKWFTNDRVASNIYGVNEDGTVDTSHSLCRVRFVYDNNVDESDPETPFKDRIILNLFDVETGEQLEKFTPAKGVYCLRLADSLFTGMYQSLIEGADPEIINSNPFDYYYTIDNGSSEVESVEVAEPAKTGDVFTLTGIRVAKNADAATIDALAPGFYIVNGKKIVK